MAEVPDVIVVGSGPAGAIAASTLVRLGMRVLMVDMGHDDQAGRERVPDLGFSEVRASDAAQRSYFVGDAGEGIPGGEVKVGAQLTPPRQFLTRDTEAHLPYTSDTFFPMQSLALGGLGAGWGAACFSFSEAELRACGIFEPGFTAHYDQVISEIGVSGDSAGDAQPHLLPGVTASGLQAPLELDTNARGLLAAYEGRRAAVNRAGLFLGRAALAVLTAPIGDRQPNPYFDMDFWSDSRRSVYRPRYTIEALRKSPGFEYRGGLLAVRFKQEPSGRVELKCLEPSSGQWHDLTARRLILCAGSLNSARLALHSLGLEAQQAPVLCNPYTYIPTLNLRMLGKAAADRRHSLAQLCGAYLPEDDPADLLSFQIYSYRSLLLFKLVKELPLPPAAGLLAARLLCNSLAIFGVHHSDALDPSNWLRLGKPTSAGLPSLEFHYAPSDALAEKRARRERGLRKAMLRLGCIPAGPVHPGHAASIHYAGTIPIEGDSPLSTRPDGRLTAVDNVWVGDSASWRTLPAKGLTLTIMANAARVATHLAAELRSRGAA